MPPNGSLLAARSTDRTHALITGFTLLGAGMAKLGPGEGKDLIVSSIPLGRMGKKWDIGMACVFLSSAAAG